MERITSATIFKAFDGTIFESETKCREYEKKRKEFLDRIKFFLVRHSPDLTETGFFYKWFACSSLFNRGIASRDCEQLLYQKIWIFRRVCTRM